MNKTSILWPGIATAGALAAAAIWTWAGTTPAHAQPSPRPQECVCSPAVSLAPGTVQLLHCQCGILTCAVTVPTGQLQCAR